MADIKEITKKTFLYFTLADTLQQNGYRYDRQLSTPHTHKYTSGSDAVSISDQGWSFETDGEVIQRGDDPRSFDAFIQDVGAYRSFSFC